MVMKSKKKSPPAPDGNIDDVLVQTPGFRTMIAESRASLAAESPVSADNLLAEARARRRRKP
jgi:hypothetical protein